MKFKDTQLPSHPLIEEAYNATAAFYGAKGAAKGWTDSTAHDFEVSLSTARYLSQALVDKNPGTIAAALVFKAAQGNIGTFSRVFGGIDEATQLVALEAAKGWTDATADEKKQSDKVSLAYAITTLKGFQSYRAPTGLDDAAFVSSPVVRDFVIPSLDAIGAQNATIAAALKQEEPVLAGDFSTVFATVRDTFSGNAVGQKNTATAAYKPA